MSCLLMHLGGSTEPLMQLVDCRIRIERRGLLISRNRQYLHSKRLAVAASTVGLARPTRRYERPRCPAMVYRIDGRPFRSYEISRHRARIGYWLP